MTKTGKDICAETVPDIVERLRERATGGFDHDDLAEEAAAEIERLLAHVTILDDLCQRRDTEIERLQAEVDFYKRTHDRERQIEALKLKAMMERRPND